MGAGDIRDDSFAHSGSNRPARISLNDFIFARQMVRSAQVTVSIKHVKGGAPACIKLIRERAAKMRREGRLPPPDICDILGGAA
jgi:hypothetical protein